VEAASSRITHKSVLEDLAFWNAVPKELEPCMWSFPAPHEWGDDDLVGGGADLSPSTLIYAYSNGMFPMGVGRSGNKIGWWSPDPRGILPLTNLRISRSMRQSRRRFTVRIDENFERVIRTCATLDREGVWITKAFIDAYLHLHELGWAHSIETYNAGGHLVGGLYGIRIGGFFAGESMFHLERDASKIALVHLVSTMRASAMSLLDVQWSTPHLASLGVVEVPRQAYLKLLAECLNPTNSLT